MDLTVQEHEREPESCMSECSATSLACVVGSKHCE